MFAPKVAKPQTKAAAASANKLASQRSVFAMRPFGGSAVERAQMLQQSIGNQATLRVLSQQTSSMTGSRPSESHHQNANPSSVATRRVTCGLSWDFSKISVFPPERATPTLGRKGISYNTSRETKAPPIVHEVLSEPGQPLDRSSRAFFEPRFRSDFSSVRIHTDAKAGLSADAVGALGYTVGDHIVFGVGQHQPATPKGRQLLAHELAHTVQQRSTNIPVSGAPIGSTNDSYESEANEAAHAVFEGKAFELRHVYGPLLARKTSEGLHDTEEIGDAAQEFQQNNSNLGPGALGKIRSGIFKLANESGTYEVAYSFYKFYSSFNNGIRQMTPSEEAKENSLGKRLAVTDTTLGFTTTTLQSVVLSYSDKQLATLLLHEFSHTGHVGGSLAGEGAYQEGQSYGIEYFYAEIAGDTNRMEMIQKIVSAGDVLGYSKAATLLRFQNDFKVTYALMTALRDVVTRGSSSHLPFPELTSARAQLLEEQVATSFQSPSADLAKYIAYVKANLSSFKIPPV